MLASLATAIRSWPRPGPMTEPVYQYAKQKGQYAASLPMKKLKDLWRRPAALRCALDMDGNSWAGHQHHHHHPVSDADDA